MKISFNIFYLVRFRDGIYTYEEGPFSDYEYANERRLMHKWTAEKYEIVKHEIIADKVHVEKNEG